MKCIKKDETIVRIADEEAHVKVTKFGWKYVPRSEWKEKIRDANKKALVSPEENTKHQETKAKRAAKRIALNSKYGK
jgi:hypothetical protein